MIDGLDITTEAIEPPGVIRCSAFLCTRGATYIVRRAFQSSDGLPQEVTWHHYCDIDTAAVLRDSAALFFERIVHLRRQRAGDSSVAS